MNETPTPPPLDYISLPPEEIALILPTLRIMAELDEKQRENLLSPRGQTHILGGNWDKGINETFDNGSLFLALREHVEENVEWTETPYYRQKFRRVKEYRATVRNMNREKTALTTETDPLKKSSLQKRFQMYRNKRLRFEKSLADTRTVEDLITEVECFTELYHNIKDNGYLSQSQLHPDGLDHHNEISVAIDRNGRTLFVDGQHRLAIAKLLGIESIPVQIVARHTRWNAFRKKVLAYAETHKGKVYQKIDHPDLAAIPFHHGPERSRMITEALKNHRKSRNVIDIGAHWGHMCHILEDLGYACTAVEMNKRHIPFIEGLRDARSKRFKIWHGSIFDYPRLKQSHTLLRETWRKIRRKRPLQDPLRPLADGGLTWLSDFDVVLALNIFHHFIKTKEGHEDLIELLKNMDAKIIFFEPHLPQEGQMKEAYRNYPPNEFAAFVAKHTRMNRVKTLGVAPDGRTLYMLTKKKK